MIRKNKAQVTIFIILAMLIIVVVAILFLLFRTPGIQVQDVENPQAYIEGCVKDFTEEAIDILSEQGGDINPKGSIEYNNKNLTYLCYNANYYLPCVNQRPLLVEHIQDEITNYIRPKTEKCFW